MGSIEDILYEDVRILRPKWFPIWVGPQQQHEPHQPVGECGLAYPLLGGRCETSACVALKNITLRDVTVEDAEGPLLIPGVVLGNASLPIEGLVFERVTVTAKSKVDDGDGHDGAGNSDSLQPYICSDVATDYQSVDSEPYLLCEYGSSSKSSR